jgi:putative molybdopterin biosynthesis protein
MRDPVSVELFRPLYEIENTVVMVGSHDLSLDLLANLLREFYPPVFFSSQHVGSLGGILAIKQGVCHMAGVHLLDPETGEYNLPYVRRYLAETPVRIIHLVEREQGLIVPKGNPKGIRGLEDLLREDVRFINRQKGSGTRILLDHELNSLSLDPRKIRGYEKEEFTHMAVASAVLSGLADVAMGILSAAKALGLDFVPITKERYDILIPSTHFAEKRIQKVIETIRSESFKEKILRMGGYDTSRTGEEISG